MIAVDQAPRRFAIDLTAPALEVRLVGTADLGALIPIQTKPAQVRDDRPQPFGNDPSRIRVGNAKHKLAAMPARVQPVEGCRDRIPNVNGSTWGRFETSANFGHCSPAAITGLESAPMPSISISTVSPGSIGPTPAGVPVMITSPGNKVMILET